MGRILTLGRNLTLLITALLPIVPTRSLSAQMMRGDPPGISGIERIEIFSVAWNGRKRIRRKLTIRATKSGYTAGFGKVDRDAIGELLDRMNAPPSALSLKSLGIDGGWLARSGLKDESDALKALNAYYRQAIILDDDAEFKLEVL